jgi:hypothetical protein
MWERGWGALSAEDWGKGKNEKMLTISSNKGNAN